MQVTLKHIAHRTGLSFQTVSRILNGNGSVHNEKTRERVLSAAQELGYRRHSTAKAMRQGRTSNLALLLSEATWTSLLSSHLRDGILDETIAQEHNLILARLPDISLTSEEKMPRILRELTSDGLLINYNDTIPEQMIALIQKYNVPAIWINSVHATDCVYPDDILAGQLATRHLIKHGHQRIAYLHWGTSHYSYHHREQGYRTEMETQGLSPRVIQTNPDLRQVVQGDMSWFQGPERYTGYFCYSPDLAIQVFLLAAGAGLRIPQDISLVTCVDAPTQFLGYQWDSVVLPYYAMGQECVRLLLTKIANPETTLPPRVLPPELVAGDTVSYHSGC